MAQSEGQFKLGTHVDAEQPPKKMVRRTARFEKEDRGHCASALQLAGEFINTLHADAKIIAVTGTWEEVLIVWEEVP